MLFPVELLFLVRICKGKLLLKIWKELKTNKYKYAVANCWQVSLSSHWKFILCEVHKFCFTLRPLKTQHPRHHHLEVLQPKSDPNSHSKFAFPKTTSIVGQKEAPTGFLQDLPEDDLVTVLEALKEAIAEVDLDWCASIIFDNVFFLTKHISEEEKHEPVLCWSLGGQ